MTYSLDLLQLEGVTIPSLEDLKKELDERIILCLITSCSVMCIAVKEDGNPVPIERIISEMTTLPSPFTNEAIVKRVQFFLKLGRVKGIF